MKVKLLNLKINLEGVEYRNYEDGSYQMNACTIIERLYHEMPNDGYCLVCLTDIDLYNDVRVIKPRKWIYYPPPYKNDFCYELNSYKYWVSICSIARFDPTFTMDKKPDDNETKIKLYTFGPEKTIIEGKDSIEILPIEKGPLKKQLVDNLFIERIFYEKPENTIQNIDKIAIFRISRPNNIPEQMQNIEILPIPKESLKGQIVDSLFIEGLIPIKIENSIQNVDKLTIFKSPKPQNIIETRDMMEIQPLEKEPFQKQLVDDLYIERLLSQKQENTIQNTNNFCIFRKQRTQNVIEPKDNIELLPKEREPLKGQLVDSLNIEGLALIKPENKIQNIDKLTIFKTPRANNLIESMENIEILPIEKEPLKKQLVDDLFIERIKSLKPDNLIQNTEKLSIFRIGKPKNMIELRDNIQIGSIERDPLQKQLVDSLYIEKIISLKPENQIQNTDKLTINKAPRPQNVIDAKENLEILPIEKEPLQKQLTDSLYVEGIKISPIHKDLIVESSDGLEILQNKEEIPLYLQKIDAIYIEGDERAFNEIQQTSSMTILKNLKKPNIIESTQDLFISAKEKPELKFQIVDEILIDGIDKDDLYIEEGDNLEILRTPMKLKQKFKNIITTQPRDSIEILAIEQEPLKKQYVDKLLIEGNLRPDNKIQIVDTMNILKAPKSKPKNIIEEKDSIFLEQIEQEPLTNKTVDNILIEGIPREDSLIQIVDKIEILRTPKPENVIELNDNIFIAPKEKKSLEKQLVDNLVILPSKKQINNVIQNVDKMGILRTPKPQNIIEQKEEFLILPKEKEPLKNVIIDNILIEGNPRQDNLIQIVDKIEILRTPKAGNIIESNDNIFIAPKEKEPLKNQIVDKILIEGSNRQDNAIQSTEKIEILKSPKQKPKNIIEENINLLFYPQEKDPLLQQIIDNLAIEGDERPDNKIQLVDKMEILKSPKSKPQNKIEEKDTIFIPANEKTKPEMKNQIVDNILIEGVNRPDNKIQILDKIDILKTPKPDNLFVGIDSIFLGPEEREPLQSQICDKLIIEPIERIENQIQKVDLIEILKTQKTPREENVIEPNDSIFIPPQEKEALQNQIVDNIKIEGNVRQNNEIQIADKMEIIKTPKPENIIQENDNIFIPPKEKESLLNQIVDNIIIEGNLRPDNKIQNIDKMDILRTARPKPENIIQENYTLFIEPKKKEPLERKVCDKLLIEGNLKPNNSIQLVDKLEILRQPKAKNIIESNANLFISSKEKEPLQMQLTDELLIEKVIKPDNISQFIDKIQLLGSQKPKIELIIQQSEDLFISPEEKESLNCQNVDSLKIEGLLKSNNKIQPVDKVEIIRTVKPKPINTIEENESWNILPKEKEPLLKQSMDNLFIEKTQRPDNAIQIIDRMQIIRKSKPKNIIIEQNESIEILPKEKDKLQNLNVDNIIIEGNIRQDNEIQYVDKFNVLKTVKAQTENKIELKDNIFIEPKQKEPLDKESRDSILIGSQSYPENNIQTKDSIQLEGITQTKSENRIEPGHVVFIPRKAKKPFLIQKLDNLIIDEIEFEEPDNEIQSLNHLEILRDVKPNPQNKVEQDSTFFIAPKQKDPLQYQLLDNILIEGIDKKDNEIQYVFKLNFAKTLKPKPKNIIQLNDNIFIEPKQKEPLELQVNDKLLIEGINRPETLIEKKDEIKIGEEPKLQREENIIEENFTLFIESKEKEPLQNKVIDKILIEGNNRPENLKQNIDKILLSEKPKSKTQNKIDPNINVLILPKEKEPLLSQPIDALAIEGNEKEEYTIDRPSQLELLKYPKLVKNIDNQIEYNCTFLIEPKQKEPLQLQLIDTIKVECVKPTENQMQQIERFNYDENKEKPRDGNIIEAPANIEIIPLKKEIPLKKQLIDSIKIKESIRPDNKIQLCNEVEILKSKKPGSIIEPECNFSITPKEKNPLEYQNVDSLFIDRLMPKFSGNKNIIENSQILELLPQKEKNEIPIEDSKEKLRAPKSVEKANIPLTIQKQEIKLEGSKIKEAKEKPKLQIDKMDDFNIEGMTRPENAIDITKKLKILKSPIEKSPNKIINNGEFFIPSTKIPKSLEEPKKAPNIITRLEEYYIHQKEKQPLEKENIDTINISNEENKNEIPLDDQKYILKTKKIYKNEIKHVDEFKIKGKEKKPLTEEALDELTIDAQIRPENAIETVKKLQILKAVHPKNEKIKYDTLPLTKDKIDEIKFDGKKIIVPENSIKTQESLFIKPKEKKTVLNIEKQDIYIEGIKTKTLAKKIQILEENKVNDIHLKGKMDKKIIPANKVKFEKELFIEGKKKQPLVEQKIINDFAIVDVDKEITPKLSKPKLEISYKDKIPIYSKDKEPLLRKKENTIFIQGIIEKKGQVKIIKPKNEIEKISPIYISSQKKPPLKKQITSELYIKNEDKENDQQELVLKGKRIKFTTIEEENKDKFTILGHIKPKQGTQSIIKDNNIKENKDSFVIKGLDEQNRALKIIKLQKPHEEISQADRFTIKRNVDPEFYEELYIFRNRYKKLKEEIKPNHENNIFIKGEPKSEAKIIQKSEFMPPKCQENAKFTIYGAQKKPYIIENKGCFNIISCDNRTFKNNLLVQGIRFGLFGNKNEPGRMTQDIEENCLLRVRNRWNDKNQAQRTYYHHIPGNNKKWNDCIQSQRCVNFPVYKKRLSLDLQKIKEIELSIINKKQKEDEITQDDYNYTSVEKDEKQRRTVKATISKVYKEKLDNDEDNKELDPFSGCKKHSGRKFDKIFKERKTASVKNQEDSEGRPSSILNKGDGERKAGTMIIGDKIGKKGGQIMLKEHKQAPFQIASKNKEIGNK